MEIRTLTPQLLEGLDLAPQPFPIVGKFCPVLSRGVWSYEEELYSQPARTETNPALSRKELEEYAQGGGNVIFLAWEEGACLGYLALELTHIGCGYVDHLEVFTAHRGKGVGTALMGQAVRWAKERDLTGLCLETQDYNLAACRFYLKQGFQLGGVNTLRYRMLGHRHVKAETALFFYLLF